MLDTPGTSEPVAGGSLRKDWTEASVLLLLFEVPVLRNRQRSRFRPIVLYRNVSHGLAPYLMVGNCASWIVVTASLRDTGMRTSRPTIATTTTMTTTFGSLKLWPATTSAAAMLRCAVPRARTRRFSTSGPPKNQPVPKPME